MKSISSLLLTSLILAQSSAMAQHKHAAHASTHAAAAGSTGSHGCVDVGEISSKVPALAAGKCAKALFTLSTLPTVKLDYAAPMVSKASLSEKFSLDANSVTLAYNEIQTGTGALVVNGKFVSLLYTGYLADGTEFDSSAKHNNDPFVLQYGTGRAIVGMNTGLEGMRVGGKRRLYIPYQLAYGVDGSPPVIPAKAQLIFDVELIGQSDTRPAPKPTPIVPSASTRPDAEPPAAAAPSAAPKP